LEEIIETLKYHKILIAHLSRYPTY